MGKKDEQLISHLTKQVERLEAENRQLAEKGLIQQTQEVRDALQFRRGMEYVGTIAADYYEPMRDALEELESVAGFIMGAVAVQGMKLPRNPEFIKAMEKALSDLDNRISTLDYLDGKLCGAMGIDSPYVDMSGVYDLRAALKEFLTHNRPKKLLAFTRSAPIRRDYATLFEAMKKREPKGLDDKTIEIGRGVAQEKRRGISWEKAAEIYLQKTGQLRTGKYDGYDPATAVSYYYRVKAAGVLSSS
jgi:hypothetical protein